MDLIQAAGLRPFEMVSLVGGGGKTSTLYRLAEEVHKAGMTALVTTTTKMFPPNPGQADFLHVVKEIGELQEALRQSPPVPSIHAAGTEINPERKLCGLPLPWFPELLKEKRVHHIIVEADGAASRPLKVPLAHEPVIPPETGLVLHVIGLDVLGKPLSSEWVHRAERAAQILKVPLGTAVQKEMIRDLWVHPDGLKKGVPLSARKIVVLNKADTPDKVEQARPLAGLLLREHAESVLITSMIDAKPLKELVTS